MKTKTKKGSNIINKSANNSYVTVMVIPDNNTKHGQRIDHAEEVKAGEGDGDCIN